MLAIWRTTFLIVAIAVFAPGSKAMGQSSAFYSKEVKHNATVKILAVSSSIHIGSGSQEIYLANISFSKIDHQLAELVDRYSANGYPVRHSLLREHRTLKMLLIRREQCDVNGQELFLPDNPEMIFDTKVRTELKNRGGM